MSVSSRVGTALAAGYVLGRFKKLRLALVVGSALANKNVRDSALSFISQGTKGLAASPEAQKIAKQITSELADAGKAAAMTAVSGRINQLSDQLSQRSASLLGEQGKSEQDQGEQEEGEQEQPQEEGEAQERGQESRDESEQGEEQEGEEGEEPEDEAEGYEGEESEDEGHEATDEYEDEGGEESGEESEDEGGEATDEYEDEGGEESGEESEDEGGETTDEYEDEEGGGGESDRGEQAARAVPRRQRAASPAARKGA